MEGIGGTSLLDLDVTDGEAGIAVDGSLQHRQAPWTVGEGAGLGDRGGSAGREKDHLIQVQHVARRLRQAEMAEMDRIEASAEQSDPQVGHAVPPCLALARETLNDFRG